MCNASKHVETLLYASVVGGRRKRKGEGGRGRKGEKESPRSERACVHSIRRSIEQKRYMRGRVGGQTLFIRRPARSNRFQRAPVAAGASEKHIAHADNFRTLASGNRRLQLFLLPKKRASCAREESVCCARAEAVSGGVMITRAARFLLRERVFARRLV